MKEEYRFTHRKGRNIQVCFRIAPDKWISTGTENPKIAIRFAERYLANPTLLLDRVCSRDEITPEITVGFIAEEFLRNDCQNEREWDLRHNKIYKDACYKNLAKTIKNNILPYQSDMDITKLSKRTIEDFYLNESDIKDSLRNHVLICYRKLLNFAVRKGYLENNPADNIKSITIRSKTRGAFSKEEMALLFPNDDEKLIKQWGGLRNACFYLLSRDTGFRPSEILGLRFSNFRDNYRAIYTSGSACPFTHKYQESIKTTFTGQDYKIGLLTEQTSRIVTLYKESSKAKDDTFLFKATCGKSQLEWSNKYLVRLNKVLNELGIEKGNRSPYSFRHSFNTDLYNNVSDSIRFELMGHTSNRPEYDNRTVDKRLEYLKKQGIPELLEKR